MDASRQSKSIEEEVSMFSVTLDGTQYRCTLWTKLLVTWWQSWGETVCFNPKEDRPAW